MNGSRYLNKDHTPPTGHDERQKLGEGSISSEEDYFERDSEITSAPSSSGSSNEEFSDNEDESSETNNIRNTTSYSQSANIT